MTLPRTLVVAALVVIGGLSAPPAPAAATPIDASVASVAIAPAAAEPVTDEQWSMPSYPVACAVADRQISCTPTNPSDVKAQQCFINVLMDGQRNTLCTTFEGHVKAIQAAGGKPLLVQYGCGVGDLVCTGFENAGRGMALSAAAMMSVVASSTRFDTSTVLWSAAVDEWSFWQWAVLMVLLGAMIWAIAAATVSGDRGELVAAIVRCFIAIIAVPLSLWVTGHLLNSVDDMTWYLISRDGPGSVFQALQSVMFAGGQAYYYFAFLIHGLLMLAMLLLMLVFTFRNIVLAALIAVGPIAWMIFPVRAIGPQWVVRYVSSIVVLLLTGPLTIGFLSLIVKGLAGVKTIWDPQSWPLLIGLVLVAFAPFAVFGLFSFVGAVAADSIGSRVGGHAGRMSAGAARAAIRIPSRIGARPAGSRPAGRTGPGSRAPSGSRPAGAPAPAGTRNPATSTSTAAGGSTGSPASSTAPSRPSAQPPSRGGIS